MKQYPLWQQFVDRQSEWIGGILTDEDAGESTKITGIFIDRHPADGPIEAWDAFRVQGEDWHCCFNTQYGGVTPSGEKDTIKFYVPAGRMSFKITKPIKQS